MDFIVKPLTDDGLVGYDQFGQFMCGTPEGHGRVSYSPVSDVRGRLCVICCQGWHLSAESMRAMALAPCSMTHMAPSGPVISATTKCQVPTRRSFRVFCCADADAG